MAKKTAATIECLFNRKVEPVSGNGILKKKAIIKNTRLCRER